MMMCIDRICHKLLILDYLIYHCKMKGRLSIHGLFTPVIKTQLIILFADYDTAMAYGSRAIIVRTNKMSIWSQIMSLAHKFGNNCSPEVTFCDCTEKEIRVGPRIVASSGGLRLLLYK